MLGLVDAKLIAELFGEFDYLKFRIHYVFPVQVALDLKIDIREHRLAEKLVDLIGNGFVVLHRSFHGRTQYDVVAVIRRNDEVTLVRTIANVLPVTNESRCLCMQGCTYEVQHETDENKSSTP